MYIVGNSSQAEADFGHLLHIDCRLFVQYSTPSSHIRKVHESMFLQLEHCLKIASYLAKFLDKKASNTLGYNHMEVDLVISQILGSNIAT